MSLEFNQLGPYQILREIGHGGMGHVYGARSKETGEPAAIKVLSPSLANAAGFRERFEAEIDSLRILSHPNIVSLFGFGEQEGHLFYAMELVDGCNLEDELAAGRDFGWQEVAHIAVQICKALKHAHDRGVIHRDLKPANLLMTSAGEIKLLDFGIARLFGVTNLTVAGGILGTADYISPEQADGRPVTDRCDQYGLGCVLYTLLAGRPPFSAASFVELLRLQRFAEADPVRRYAPETPVALEGIISQLLQKNPDDRFPNAQVLGRQIERLLDELSDTAELPGEGDYEVEVSGKGTQLAADEPERPGVIDTKQVRHKRPADVPHDGVTGLPRDVTQLERYTDDGGEYEVEEPPQSTSRFITVEAAAEQEREASQRHWIFSVLQAVSLAATLLAVVAVLAYMMQPPSEKVLYERISAAAANDDIGVLVSMQDDVELFLSQYPDSDRYKEVRGYREDIELALTERKLRARARRRGRTEGSLSSMERMYVRAIRNAQSDPEEAMGVLSALIDLYEGAALNETQRRCLTLAQRQYERLAERVYNYAPDDLKSMEQRFAHAMEIKQQDPAAAGKIFHAITILGKGKPWAADLIAKCTAQLSTLPSLRANQEQAESSRRDKPPPSSPAAQDTAARERRRPQ